MRVHHRFKFNPPETSVTMAVLRCTMRSPSRQPFAPHVVDAPLSPSSVLTLFGHQAHHPIFSHIFVNPLKHDNYGIGQASPKGLTFALNVTPATFVEPENDSLDSHPLSATHSLFPPALAPPSRQASTALRVTRPPNAFMLFCADFVRQKHVPGSIETNHGSLSKIIGQYPNIRTF